MITIRPVILTLFCCFAAAGLLANTPTHPLTVVALGDAGNRGAILRGNAGLVTAMTTGEHDAGVPDVLLFLGCDFGETGLNVPASDVDGEVNGTLGFFRDVIARLGRSNVHGIPGETEYYSHRAVETTALFGLVSLSKWPIGVSDRGVARAGERREWTYHGHYPSSAVYPTNDGTSDSVQFVFMDTGILMRTKPATWFPVLDSLRRLLSATRNRPGIRWHLLCSHHPLVSYGEHGGYTQWNEDDSTVSAVTGCDKDTNAFRFVHNWLDPEDLCTDRYQAYIDSVGSILASSGVEFQAQLSSHDLSLQLIDRNPAHGNPHVQIISGCGSAAGLARIGPYSSARKENEGVSLPGIVQLRWQEGSLLVTFFGERNGEKLDMGTGATVFRIDGRGTMTEVR